MPNAHAGYDHTHEEDASLVIEDNVGNLEGKIIIDALQSVLIARGLLTAPEVVKEIEKLESPGIHLGAQIVAKAWTDPEYKSSLLENGKQAIGGLGITVGEAQIIVVENTPQVHNLITCTLCSCYPRSILGQPPSWYISKSYRARAVREPREVLREFGTVLPEKMDLVVHDSNADMRYLVLPECPDNVTDLTISQLQSTVTRDRLIGVTR